MWVFPLSFHNTSQFQLKEPQSSRACFVVPFNTLQLHQNTRERSTLITISSAFRPLSKTTTNSPPHNQNIRRNVFRPQDSLRLRPCRLHESRCNLHKDARNGILAPNLCPEYIGWAQTAEGICHKYGRCATARVNRQIREGNSRGESHSWFTGDWIRNFLSGHYGSEGGPGYDYPVPGPHDYLGSY